LVKLSFTQGIDVVVIDRGDDVLEEARLLVDTPVGGRLSAEQPASTDDGEHEDSQEAAPTSSTRRCHHVELLPRNAR
jgi:hypothetical protein